MDFQKEKQLVRDFYAALDNATGDAITETMERFCAPAFLWRGYHPFHEQTDPKAVADVFWKPLHGALGKLQRRMDVFMAGRNAIDGGQSTWVVSMGHLMGLFDAPWLGIPPTGKMAFLRYCAFHRVEADKITETAMFFDIPHLMMQAGLQPFPPQTAAHLVQPGPMTHDGLLFDEQPALEGEKTLKAIDFMVKDISNWQSKLSLEDELRRSWNEDMIWWGPAGIGATYTIERYAKQHSGPFRAGFEERKFNGHVAKIAEGHFGGFFGWPNLTLKPSGGFMGFPATGKAGDMRVIDIYRRDGDKLTENWVFIDLLHFWNQQGLDVLGRLKTVPHK
ncbi:MAG: nuclear transport factor 2 family protein [Planktotalea sp.]|uniref:nuclear transport factor 2 family protein n=1 Tax=Planktotalea sp. TaxID=2029877 RepID=UPI003C78F8CB